MLATMNRLSVLPPTPPSSHKSWYRAKPQKPVRPQRPLKPTMEYFVCGHARFFDNSLPTGVVGKQVSWYEYPLMPSQGFHIFTNTPCHQKTCNTFIGSQVKRCMPYDYNGTDHLQLQKRYAEYHFELAEIGRRLSEMAPEVLEAVLPLELEWLQRAFKFFPHCFESSAELNPKAIDTADIQILLDRVLDNSDAGRTPPFAIHIMSRLGSMRMGELEYELTWIIKYVDHLEKLEEVIYINDLTDESGKDLTEYDLDYMLMDRFNIAKEFFGVDLETHHHEKDEPCILECGIYPMMPSVFGWSAEGLLEEDKPVCEFPPAQYHPIRRSAPPPQKKLKFQQELTEVEHLEAEVYRFYAELKQEGLMPLTLSDKKEKRRGGVLHGRISKPPAQSWKACPRVW